MLLIILKEDLKMTVQISGRQIKNSAVGVTKLDLSTGTFDFTSAVLQVATPTADSHAASKGYVDSQSQGLDVKDSVKAATTGNITLSGTQSIDGISIVADDRVLVKDQSTASENGIYLCKAGAWARSDDFAAGSAEAGAFCFVEQGTVNAENGYVCTADKGSDIVGTNNLPFAQFSGAGQITAGSGLTKSGNTLNVQVDDSSIEIASDTLRVKASGITNAMLGGSIANAKLANSTISGVALGANLNALSAGNGISMTSYNGSAAVSDLTIDLDGSTLAVGGSGIKIADGGVGSTQIADDAVVSAKIADGAIDSAAYIADSLITNAKLAGSIANAKLANSTISGVALGGNLAGLAAGQGLAIGSAYNGSAGQTMDLQLDGSTLAKSGSGVKVADLGVGTGQLAADCITNAKIADDSVQTENLNFAGFFSGFDISNDTTSAVELPAALDLEFKQFFVVTVNGLVMEYKDTPDAQDNYKIANDGTGGVAKITFGANLANGDRVTIRGFVNN